MGFTLDNWPGHLFAARGAFMHHCLMATYVCFILCALYILPITHGRFISFSTYIVSYVHCNLALLGSKAQRSICEICSTNLASFLGFLGFFMDLLVQDSIWIYLWPCGLFRYLCSEGGDTTLYFTL